MTTKTELYQTHTEHLEVLVKRGNKKETPTTQEYQDYFNGFLALGFFFKDNIDQLTKQDAAVLTMLKSVVQLHLNGAAHFYEVICNEDDSGQISNYVVQEKDLTKFTELKQRLASIKESVGKTVTAALYGDYLTALYATGMEAGRLHLADEIDALSEELADAMVKVADLGFSIVQINQDFKLFYTGTEGE